LHELFIKCYDKSEVKIYFLDVFFVYVVAHIGNIPQCDMPKLVGDSLSVRFENEADILPQTLGLKIQRGKFVIEEVSSAP